MVIKSPEIARITVPSNTCAIALAFSHDLLGYTLKCWLKSFMECNCFYQQSRVLGVPLGSWEDPHCLIFTKFFFAKIKPPRGPRNVLCVVDVTTSYGTGF